MSEQAQVKVSARGVAIACFVARIPELQNATFSVEAFRVAVTADIAEKLSMPVDDCGYLFNKARRATERGGKFNDIDFGAAKRAEPVVKATAPAATEGGEAAQATTATEPTSFSLFLVEDGKVTKAFTYASKGIAKMQFSARSKKGGNWITVDGPGPVVGDAWSIEADKAPEQAAQEETETA